jgi:CO/xanthine dehydrogenase FAD-binding subunit
MVVQALHLPESADDAAARAAGGAWIMAGGTLVMPAVTSGDIPSRWGPAPEIVGLSRAGLSEITAAAGTVRIGAAATLATVAEHPALTFLTPAVASIGSPTLRQQATVGGNLFAPSPYGDLAVCLLALDATCDVAGAGDPLPVGDVIAGSGGRLPAGGLVTAVTLTPPAAGTWHYRKAMRRRQNSAAVVTVAAVVALADGVVSSVRIALGGVAPRPVRAAAAEAALLGRPLEPGVVAAAADAARADAAPADDAYASAWYRDRVLPVHLRRALLG